MVAFLEISDGPKQSCPNAFCIYSIDASIHLHLYQEGTLERGKPPKSQRCAGGIRNRATKRGSLWWINSTEESEKGRGVGVGQTTKCLA